MVNIRTLCLAAALFLAPASGAYAFCFDEAGAQYGINPQILRAIAKVESNFNPNAVHKNTNGTYDFGLMQINSIWASTLGKERWNSLGDACSNTKAGAWILSMCMEKYGYTWKAIGCYNSQTPDKRDRYSRMVFDQLQRVKPLEVEQAYSPLKNQLEGVVRDNVEQWVTDAAQGKGDEFAMKVKAQPIAPKRTEQEPPNLNQTTPSLSDSNMQETLGLPAPRDLTINPDIPLEQSGAEQAATDQGQTAVDYGRLPSPNSAGPATGTP